MPAFAPARPLLTLARFLVSGGAATLLHWVVMAVLIRWGADAAVATACAAALGALANYLLQFHLTFRARADHQRALPRYLLASVLGWLANLLVFYALHALLGLGVPAAQGLTSLLVAVLNFHVYQRVVFHERTVAAGAA